MKTDKVKIMNDIKDALKKAQDAGYKIVVASDEEANGWNTLDAMNLYYDNTQSDYIAIGVIGFIDVEEVFNDTF